MRCLANDTPHQNEAQVRRIKWVHKPTSYLYENYSVSPHQIDNKTCAGNALFVCDCGGWTVAEAQSTRKRSACPAARGEEAPCAQRLKFTSFPSRNDVEEDVARVRSRSVWDFSALSDLVSFWRKMRTALRMLPMVGEY